ncbi:hypothetical protein SAMN05216570_2574 [Dyella sp. OK004]|uniref:hypothetical protein n=1 Tax=Dyella sp. OK004 TaxID=1855292 RepID=UPI0008E3952B|nr:hypothetical protein [Dyella sp. OK004]SFS11838.1 hypothetical protein SAMN05216570_2574 [Dyella sp. OK004]
MSNQFTVAQQNLGLTQLELGKADAALQQLGVLAPATVQNDRGQEILAAVKRLDAQQGLTKLNQTLDPGLVAAIVAASKRFCSVADTPPQTQGVHVLNYGTPIGTWPRGNLSYYINTDGIQGLDPAVAYDIIDKAYAAYADVQPFFLFTPGGPD